MFKAGEAEPAWLIAARREVGTRERAGSASNPDIVAYYRDVGHDWVSSDAVAWCAAFAGACLERQGIASTRSLRARSYLTWGVALAAPRPGAIAVFARGDDPAQGHVGFVAAHWGDRLDILGGNQADQVSIASYPRRSLLGLRWPAIPVTASDARDFDRALAHVLLQEGGWSDHPDDPGGPTQHGITLAVFARHLGEPLTTANRDRLMAALRSISDDQVSAIYRQRYWQRAACDKLAAGPALMHFDAAVNQGPVTAIRLLQQALSVEADGEFGPLTQAAAERLRPEVLIARYAEERLARYRATRNFTVFGRGWTSRVARTKATALALASTAPQSTSPAKENETMVQQPKWWGRSLTIWGAFITALSTVLPLLGPLLGIDLTADTVRQFGDQVTQMLQLLGGIIGTLLTIYGRFRADAPLERKSFRLSL